MITARPLAVPFRLSLLQTENITQRFLLSSDSIGRAYSPHWRRPPDSETGYRPLGKVCSAGAVVSNRVREPVAGSSRVHIVSRSQEGGTAVRIALVLARPGTGIFAVLFVLSLSAACSDLSYPYEGYGGRPGSPEQWLLWILGLAFACCVCWLASRQIKDYLTLS